VKTVLNIVCLPEEVDRVVAEARRVARKAARSKRWVWSPEGKKLVDMTKAEYRALEDAEDGISTSTFTKKQVNPLPDGRVQVLLYESAPHVQRDSFRLRTSDVSFRK